MARRCPGRRPIGSARQSRPSGSGAGVGSDRFNPRQTADLSDHLLEAVIDFGMECEELGGWPDVITDSLLVMLPKPQGGCRPIGLLGWLPRL
eukprot:9479433-Pyramimonas_sp.AAC.2